MWIFSGFVSPLWQKTEYIWVVNKTLEDVILGFGRHWSTFCRPNKYWLINQENNGTINPMNTVSCSPSLLRSFPSCKNDKLSVSFDFFSRLLNAPSCIQRPYILLYLVLCLGWPHHIWLTWRTEGLFPAVSSGLGSSMSASHVSAQNAQIAMQRLNW